MSWSIFERLVTNLILASPQCGLNLVILVSLHMSSETFADLLTPTSIITEERFDLNQNNVFIG